MGILCFLAVVVIAPAILVLVQYNGLISLRNHIRDAWSNVDTELKRRHDLIPNLVATVKGYAAHEQALLEKLTDLRSRCLSRNGSARAVADDETQLTSELQRLWVVVENYPELKADQHFLKLQHELVNTEDRIQAARRFYNGNVRDYRNKCETIPSNIVASLFGFQAESYFGVEDDERELPSVRM